MKGEVKTLSQHPETHIQDKSIITWTQPGAVPFWSLCPLQERPLPFSYSCDGICQSTDLRIVRTTYCTQLTKSYLSGVAPWKIEGKGRANLQTESAAGQ